MGQRYSTQRGECKNLVYLKDHFSSNSKPRSEHTYIKVRPFLEDRALTPTFRWERTSKTNTADRHAHSHRLDRAVRVVAGMEGRFIYHIGRAI